MLKPHTRPPPIEKKKMCVIQGEVSIVSNTKILVAKCCDSEDGGKRQLTVYQNKVGFKKPKTPHAPVPAMILPFPNPATLASRADPVEFVDMTNMKSILSHLETELLPPTFHGVHSIIPTRGYETVPPPPPPLEVKRVGSYQCSVATSLDDIVRIDPSVFQVSESVCAFLKTHYPQDFGFVICHPAAEYCGVEEEGMGVRGHSFEPIAFVHPRILNNKRDMKEVLFVLQLFEAFGLLFLRYKYSIAVQYVLQRAKGKTIFRHLS